MTLLLEHRRDIDDLVAEDLDVERERETLAEDAFPFDAEEPDAGVDVEAGEKPEASRSSEVVVAVFVVVAVVVVVVVALVEVLRNELPLPRRQELLAEREHQVPAVFDLCPELDNSPNKDLKEKTTVVSFVKFGSHFSRMVILQLI